MNNKTQEILDKYNNILEEYTNKVMPKLGPVMDRQRQPYKTFFKKLFDFYLLTSYLADSKVFPDDGKFPGLRILYAKSCHSILGIHSCLKNGLASEAAVILRSLFETKLHVKLILENNTTERDNLYNEFHFVEKWNNLQAKRLLVSNSIISQEDFNSGYGDIDQIEKDYQRIKQNYHPSHPYHWAWKLFNQDLKGKNPNIKIIADYLGLSDDYVRVYGALSLSSHGSPNLINSLTSSGSISTAPIFNDQIFTIGCLAVGYLANMIIGICGFLKFGDDDEISIYTNAFTLSIVDEYTNHKQGRAMAPNTG